LGGADESRVGDRIEGKAQTPPLVEAASEGANALDAQLVQGHRGFGGGSLAGAGAEKHDIAVAGISTWRWASASGEK